MSSCRATRNYSGHLLRDVVESAGLWIHVGDDCDRGSRQLHLPHCPCHRLLVSAPCIILIAIMPCPLINLKKFSSALQDGKGWRRAATLACRLTKWLAQLGDAKTEKLSELMDLLAQGVIVPFSGKNSVMEFPSRKETVQRAFCLSNSDSKIILQAGHASMLHSGVCCTKKRKNGSLENSYKHRLRVRQRWDCVQARNSPWNK